MTPQGFLMLGEIECSSCIKIDQANIQMKKKLFRKYKWPIIDVTRKSVEETAASIIKIFDILNSK